MDEKARPDEGEPFSIEWLAPLGFVFNEDGYGSADWYSLGDLTYHPSAQPDWEWRWKTEIVKSPKTRGEVLRLCLALGAPIKEEK